ncbi:ribonuclease HII [Verrucomicrobiota bacterium]
MPAKPDILLYERKAWTSGFSLVAGVDEAGRGPLVGPVVAAAVVFDVGFLSAGVPDELLGLTDSKALTEKKRDHFFELLRGLDAVQIGVGVCSAEEIDRINILRATHKAMALALDDLDVAAQFALVDGNPVQGLPCPSENIVKGDALSLSISAASVIAKVTRDRMIYELDKLHPEYGFARHKGYGTAEHIAAIHEHGPLPCHRKTFRPISELNQLDFGF